MRPLALLAALALFGCSDANLEVLDDDDAVVDDDDAADDDDASANAPPDTPRVEVTPAEPGDGDPLSCALLDAPSDPDGDDVELRWAWRVDDVDAEVDGPWVSADRTRVGEAWTCSVTATDGVDDSDPGEATVVILGCAVGASSDCPAVSCSALHAADASLPTGTYWLGPADPFQAWCDMATDGGGWTLAFKQVDHETTSFATDRAAAGSAALLSEDYATGGSGASILDLVPHAELLFKQAADVWILLPTTFAGWPVHSSNPQHRCRDLGLLDPPPTCRGVDCGTYAHISAQFAPSASFSGFSIGAYHSDFGHPECGENWCSSTRHGRYDGSCQSGPVGLGDWMVLVR